jgi:hypothetical protein
MNFKFCPSLVSFLAAVFVLLQSTTCAISQEAGCGSLEIGAKCQAPPFTAEAPKSTREDQHSEVHPTYYVPNGYIVFNVKSVSEVWNDKSEKYAKFTFNSDKKNIRSRWADDYKAQTQKIENYLKLVDNLDNIAQSDDIKQNMPPARQDEVKEKLNNIRRKLAEWKLAKDYVLGTAKDYASGSKDFDADTITALAESNYQCTRVGCIDGKGNIGKGHLEITLVYVGDEPATKVDLIDKDIKRILSLVPTIELKSSIEDGKFFVPPVESTINVSSLLDEADTNTKIILSVKGGSSDSDAALKCPSSSKTLSKSCPISIDESLVLVINRPGEYTIASSNRGIAIKPLKINFQLDLWAWIVALLGGSVVGSMIAALTSEELDKKIIFSSSLLTGLILGIVGSLVIAYLSSQIEVVRNILNFSTLFPIVTILGLSTLAAFGGPSKLLIPILEKLMSTLGLQSSPPSAGK